MPTRFRPVRTRAASARGGAGFAVRWAAAAVVVLLVTFLYADSRVRPMVAASAQAVAKRAATTALNDAVSAEIAADADFQRIVQIDKVRNGQLAAVHIDFAAVTDLQAAATDRADAALRALAETTLRLPWTQVVGGSLFSTFAPNLPFRITLIGDAHSSVRMETRTEGVNQSVHVVYLDLTADVNVVSPFVTAPVSISTRVPIAYVVLAGEVPKTFVGGQANTPYGAGAALASSAQR